MNALSRRSLVFGSIGLAACGDDATTTVDETAVLKDLAEIVARPSYDALASASITLETVLGALASNISNATLSTAQDAWRAAMVAWNATRTFGFGPAKGVEGNIRWHLGCDTEAIEELVAAGGPFDVASLGTSRKGLPALEYLLFDPVGGRDAVVAALRSSAPRAELVAALATDLAAQIEGLVSAWDKHAGELATSGAGSTVYESPKDGLDALYNQTLYCADLAIAQIADPLGSNTGSLSPELEEARRSDNTLADTYAQIGAVSSVFEGTFGDGSGLGLAHLLRDRSAALEDDLRTLLTAAKAALDAIPPPLRTALAGDVSTLEMAVERLRDLKRFLNTDVATALGVTITFSDMDGD